MLQLPGERGEEFWVNPEHVLVVSSGRQREDLCAIIMDHTPEALVIRGLSAEAVAGLLNRGGQGATRFVELTDQDGSREWVNAGQVRQIRAACAEITEVWMAPFVRLGFFGWAGQEGLKVKVREEAAKVAAMLA